MLFACMYRTNKKHSENRTESVETITIFISTIFSIILQLMDIDFHQLFRFIWIFGGKIRFSLFDLTEIGFENIAIMATQSKQH